MADNAYNKSLEEKKLLQLQVSWSMNPTKPREAQWHLVCLEGTEINGTALIHWRIGLVYNHGQLINWGPITNASPNNPPRPTDYYTIAELDTDQRTILEDISREQEVIRGDPDWNGQNWIKELLATAQLGGIVTPEPCKEAIIKAEAKKPEGVEPCEEAPIKAEAKKPQGVEV